MNYATGTKGFYQWLAIERPKQFAAIQQSMTMPTSFMGASLSGIGSLGDDSTDVLDLSSNIDDTLATNIDSSIQNSITAPSIDIASTPSVPTSISSLPLVSSAPTTSMVPSIASGIANLVSTAVNANASLAQTAEQQQLFNLNLQRAQMGLPPISSSMTVASSSSLVLIGLAFLAILALKK